MPRIETFSTVVSATPAIASFATPFSSGDNIGGKLSLTPEATLPRLAGKIVSLRLTDKGKQDAAIDVVFFVAGDPTGTTFTDNTAQTIADADLLNCFTVKIVAGDYSDFADNSVATKGNIQIRFKTSPGQFLFAALVSRGTPTYTSATDLKLEVAIEQDT